MKPRVLEKIIFIVGPTAVGKTQVALELASHLPCEIVSCDAMQVYREISIATSKPTLSDRKQVAHHLFDIVCVSEKFDVVMFNKAARAAVDRIKSQNKCPLIVGGSGMYMQVLLDGIFETEKTDPALRQKLEVRAQKEGLGVLYEQLQKVDSQAASKIHPHDRRRIVRALEVFETTQTPISQLQKKRCGFWKTESVVVFGLDRPRDELYERINARVEQMFEEGLVDEVKALLGRDLGLTARRIIGVKEILAHLNGEYDIKFAKELIKKNTRNFAKRQLTWFRKDQRIEWISVSRGQNARMIAEEILKRVGQS